MMSNINNYKTAFRSQRGHFYSKKIWTMSKTGRKLFSIDTQTGIIEKEDTIDLFEEKTVIYTTGTGEKLYIISAEGKECVKYCPVTGEMSHIDISGNLPEDNDTYLFSGTASWKNMILLVPSGADEFRVLDTVKEEIQIFEVNTGKLQLEQFKKIGWFGSGVRMYNGLVFLPGFFDCFISIFDLESMDYVFHDMSNSCESIGNREVAVTEKDIYLVNKNQHILRYDRLTYEFNEMIEKLDCKEFSSVLCCDNGKIWIPAFNDKPFLIREEESGIIEKISFPDSYVSFLDGERKELGMPISESDDEYYYYPHMSNTLLCIDKKTATVRFLKLRYGKSMLGFIQNLNGGVFLEEEDGVWHPNQNGIIREYSLREFINII